MPMVNGKKFPYTGKGMMDAAAAKKKLGSSRPMTGGQGQIDRGSKALKKAGYNMLYDSKPNSSARLDQVKMALKAYNVKAKNVTPRIKPVPKNGGKVDS